MLVCVAVYRALTDAQDTDDLGLAVALASIGQYRCGERGRDHTVALFPPLGQMVRPDMRTRSFCFEEAGQQAI
ncbi:MAG: hypothetical protein AUH30_12690 [Candidatus Rokubacteria bacterium 13_1_40CM_68_15]|nr:MAG: hypothetical protein AUH30_12690 [Candidatus Rokubacteria bacterium 13_1_40CM_68_15]